MQIPSPPQVQPVQRLSFTKPGRVIKAYTCVNLKPEYPGEPPTSKTTGEFAGYVKVQIQLLHGANYNDPGCYGGAIGNQGCHLFSNRQMGSSPTAMASCLAAGGLF
ncbi:hypothetical protein SPB21_24990 [Leptothoe sp. ISB3NOV94-8A]|nr:hypothetical protein [Adonisia turfae]MDV3347801.1 hypothetical protein [Leptothoe sp. LEGE 181152]